MSLRSVLITGCSAGGIGSALAESFQKHNLQVFATARSLSKMSHLKKLPNVTLLALDVTSASDIAKAVESVKSKTGGTLDYLVNNSGAQYACPTLDVDITRAKAMFDVNFWGVLAVTQAFAPLLIAAKGTLVTIGSINAVLNVPWMSVYSASKSAVTMLAETLRLELAPFGVKVLTVVTGAIESKIMENGPQLKLPESSLYTKIEGIISDRVTGKEEIQRMTASDYAERVVQDILSGADGKVWRGQMASMVHLTSLIAPTFLVVCSHLTPFFHCS